MLAMGAVTNDLTNQNIIVVLVLFRLTLVRMGANLHFLPCLLIKHSCIVVDDAAHFDQVCIVQCYNI